jgi:hypothetical protein
LGLFYTYLSSSGIEESAPAVSRAFDMVVEEPPMGTPKKE